MKKLASLALLALAFAAPAHAQMGSPAPYTFTVPVRLENLPETTSVSVDCAVSTLGVGVDGGMADANLVARGETTSVVTGGRFNGDVTVPTVYRTAWTGHAASYTCGIYLIGSTSAGAPFRVSAPVMYTRVTGRPITSSVAIVTGTVR